MPVQIRTEASPTARGVMLPQVLVDSAVLMENLLFLYPVYNQDGYPMAAPKRNRVVSAMQAA